MTTKLTDKNISNVSNLGISWQAVIVADGSTATSVEAGKGYFIDTTSNAHTVTLPSSPNAGDTIAIKDYAGTFATNNLTISRNGHNIQGVANNSLISTNRANVELAYIDSTKGWLFTNESNVGVLYPTYITATGGTITTSGDFKIHSFTGDGCFVVSTIGNPAGSTTGDYLVVAGGGGGASGGNGEGGGGGGAGGNRTSFPGGSSIPLSVTTYPVTVGSGGAGGVFQNNGVKGSNSVFSTITSTGGGYGGYGNPGQVGGPGGSGGGGGSNTSAVGGTGNSPPTSPSQGNSGGTGGIGGSDGGGGGGTGAIGNDSGGGVGGVGGAGSANLISGCSVTIGGGGGGGGSNSGSPGAGGSGGGGAGGAGAPFPVGIAATAGAANTGGGGGGTGQQFTGAAGGSGIVIIRYKFQ